ncbi:hypothetical protein CBER1_11237 [Cercospora berteroae]|uniref:Methyltransferase domain-containing protein n=1 Tax=Cercospora berteroae TaxID=357750 RepID=A0A2S6CGX1_9PEZI|nr:hypothetical protein CBER1_11237 [Cercospora berteroae]
MSNSDCDSGSGHGIDEENEYSDVDDDLDYDCLVLRTERGRSYYGLETKSPYPTDQREERLQVLLHRLYIRVQRHDLMHGGASGIYLGSRQFLAFSASMFLATSVVCSRHGSSVHRNVHSGLLSPLLAPLITAPTRCLDMGTGVGQWAVSFADAFKDCQVIGRDTRYMFTTEEQVAFNGSYYY